jgi:hypothetical protein
LDFKSPALSVLLLLALEAAAPADKSATCDAKPFSFGVKKTASVAAKPTPPPKPAPRPKPKPPASAAGVAPCKDPPKT